MSKLPLHHQTSQEIISDALNDDTKDWLTRVIESAESQYRALQKDGVWHERKDTEKCRT